MNLETSSQSAAVHLKFASSSSLYIGRVALNLIWVLRRTLWLLLDQLKEECNAEDSSL